MSRSKATSSPVPMSIAVMRSSRSGQSCDGNRWAITSRRTASDTVGVERATAPMRCSFCVRRGVGVGERVQKQRGDVVDVDAGVDLLGCASDLTLVQLVEAQATAELGGDRRTGRCAEQHVGIQQRARRFRRFVFDTPQNADFPGDSRQSPAGQHQRHVSMSQTKVCQAGDNRPAERQPSRSRRR